MLEPFITPAIYQKYPNAIDEWTLHTLMAADTASGGLNQLDDHYNTFIVRSLYFAHSKELISCRSIADRGGLCSDSRCGAQLGAPADRILGYRHLGWRAVLAQSLLEVRAQGI